MLYAEKAWRRLDGGALRESGRESGDTASANVSANTNARAAAILAALSSSWFLAVIVTVGDVEVRDRAALNRDEEAAPRGDRAPRIFIENDSQFQ